jgi:hypothetical protein
MVEHRRWVAEKGLERLVERCAGPAEVSTLPVVPHSLVVAAQRALEEAKVAYAGHLKTGKVTDGLLRGAIYLAQLEAAVRGGGHIDPHLGTAFPEDVLDLRKLLSLVDAEAFRARRACHLNPTFGAASRLVGGADADFIVDSMLVDIKTSKELTLRRENFNQLIGYMVLNDLAGVRDPTARRPVTELAIYFSRYGLLETFKVKDLVNPATYPAFVEWFVEANGAKVLRRPPGAMRSPAST